MIAAWIWYGPGRVAPQARPHEVLALGDQGAVPQAAVLVGQQHQRSVGGDAGGPPRLAQQQQGEQAERFALVGHQLDEHPGEADRLDAQVGAHQGVATRRRVALVEHEVDDSEHGTEPVGQLGVVGDPIGDVGGADLLLRPHQALRHRRLGHEECPGDLVGL